MMMSFLRITLPLFLLMISFTPSRAQIRKGAWHVGGDASFAIPFGNGKTFDWECNLNPRVGYFVGKNLAVGAAVPFGYSALTTKKNATVIIPLNGEYVSLRKQSTVYGGLSPFVRRYFGAADAKWRPFLHAEAGRSRYVYQTEIEDRPTVTIARNQLNGQAGVGLTYLVRDHIGLEALLAYRYNAPSPVEVRSYGSSLGLTFGLQFYLFKRQ